MHMPILLEILYVQTRITRMYLRIPLELKATDELNYLDAVNDPNIRLF
jgi:hypothetical protein